MAPTPSDYTDRLPLFHGLGGGLHVSPADLLLLALLTIWVLKRETAATTSVPRSAVTYAVAAVALAAFVGLAVGQAHGGELRTALTEVRPYMYLAIAYLVATVFTTRLSVLHTAMWAIVLGSGFKAAQALHSFLGVRNQIPRPDFIVGHEEALFFSLFILLTACLWIFRMPGPLRTTATVLLPLVLVADLVNSRRAAWLILGGELIALSIVTMVAVPSRRRFMGKVLALLVVDLGRLLPGLLEPHRRARRPRPRSQVGGRTEHARRVVRPLPHPGEREPQVQHPGRRPDRPGLRRPDRLHARGRSPTSATIDPMIRFVPHNGVLYILMRMGLLGGIAFWSLLGDRDHHRVPARSLAEPRGRGLRHGARRACWWGTRSRATTTRASSCTGSPSSWATLLGLGEAARRLDARALVAQPAAAGALPARPRTAPPPARPAPRRKPRPAPAPALVRAAASPRRFDRIAQRAALVLLPIAIGFFVWLVFAGAGNETSAPSSGTQTRTGPRDAARR